MVTKEMAEREMSTGLSAVCAWCEHWHNNKDRNHEVVCGQSCGGPKRGMAFPKYKGPWEGSLVRLCFVCGDEPDAMAEIKGQGMVGVCSFHVGHMKKILASPNGKSPIVRERWNPVPRTTQ